MCIMVKALAVLGKIPEAVESFKGRIKRDMLMIIRRATDQVAKRFQYFLFKFIQEYL